jgi:hypothetical protein
MLRLKKDPTLARKYPEAAPALSLGRLPAPPLMPCWKLESEATWRIARRPNADEMRHFKVLKSPGSIRPRIEICHRRKTARSEALC